MAMHRKASFGSTFNLPRANSMTSMTGAGERKDSEEEEVHHSPHVLFLKHEGSFGNKHSLQASRALASGKLLTIWNYPTRNKLWQLTSTAFHPKTGTVALADERGQVFKLNLQSCTYQRIRTASTPLVTALCFLPGSKTQLALAHANGNVQILDTHSQDSLAHLALSTTSSTKGKHSREFNQTITMMRAHPTRPLLVLATQSQQVLLIDLRYVAMSIFLWKILTASTCPFVLSWCSLFAFSLLNWIVWSFSEYVKGH